MDIEEVCGALVKGGKKAPLIVALSVFDTLQVEARKQSFQKIAKIQNTGDHLVMMLDISPCLNEILPHMEMLYPGFTSVPFQSLTLKCAKARALMVRLENLSHKMSVQEWAGLMHESAQALLTTQQLTQIQCQFHLAQKKDNLPVIILEDLFVR